MEDNMSAAIITAQMSNGKRFAVTGAWSRWLERWLSKPPLAGLTIGARIIVIALTLAVPLNLIIFAVIWHLSENASEAQRTSLLYTARSIAAAVDAKFGDHLSLVQALARSPALLEERLDTFEAEARRAFTSQDAWVLVADLKGQQLLNTAKQASQPLPIRDPIGLATQKRAFETHSAVISDVHFGAVPRDWLVSLDIPIFKHGEPFRALSVVVKAQSFFRLLNDYHIPKDWIAIIVDGQGRFISRASERDDDDLYTGQLLSESWRNVKDQNGIFEVFSVEDAPVIAANAHSETSGWLIGIAVKKTKIQAAAWNAIRWATILGGSIFLLSLLLAGAMARSITSPIDRLRQKAALAEAEPSIPPPGPPEVRDLWQALEQSSADRDRSEKALRESEERLRLSNAAAGIGTFTIDLEAGCAQYSLELAIIVGFPWRRTAKLEDLFARVHRDDLHRIRSQYEAGLKGEGNGQIRADFRLVRPGGEIRWVTWAGRVDFRQQPDGRKPFRVAGACVDITERKCQEEQIRLLMREVNHRSKNMLALVQAVARQTLAANPKDFLDRFEKRVEALAANQDLLVKNAWKGAHLHELVESQLAPFEDLIGSRIELRGPPVFISASAAQVIGMALHELATNAGKYGALSGGDGRVEIVWRIQCAEAGEEMFFMSWCERCTDSITAPSKLGFGSSVISSLAEMSLGAKVDLDFPPTGLTWQLICAAVEVLEGGIRSEPTTETEGTADRDELPGRRPRILIVEDEALIAIEIARALTEAGFDIVGQARNASTALALLKRRGCDAAVLDINLGGGTSETIAIALTASKTPFVTLSGYSHNEYPSMFAGAVALTKPLRPHILIAELKKCTKRISEAG
jgi:two-component sensor histidine kinase